MCCGNRFLSFPRKRESILTKAVFPLVMINSHWTDFYFLTFNFFYFYYLFGPKAYKYPSSAPTTIMPFATAGDAMIAAPIS